MSWSLVWSLSYYLKNGGNNWIREQNSLLLEQLYSDAGLLGRVHSCEISSDSSNQVNKDFYSS